MSLPYEDPYEDKSFTELMNRIAKNADKRQEEERKFRKELSDSLEKDLADMYHRFIEKSINILNVSLATIGEDSYSTEQVVVMLEFSYERPKDGRIIWPKICISGETALGAISRAERVIDSIRSM